MAIHSRVVGWMAALSALALPITASAVTIGFDDALPPLNLNGTLPNGYAGFNWSNFTTVNTLLLSQIGGTSPNGYVNGVVSPDNVIGNTSATPANVYAISQDFDFTSVFLTGAFNNGLSVRVIGYDDGNQVYDTTVVTSFSTSTQFVFNYLSIDRIEFQPSGGTPAGSPINPPGGAWFVLDDLVIVPEPSTAVLVGLGLLIARVTRRRGSGR